MTREDPRSESRTRAALDDTAPPAGRAIGPPWQRLHGAPCFVEELGARVRAGPSRCRGAPTSESTRALAVQCGIPMLDDVGPWAIDVNVDGADEVSARLDLIKKWGRRPHPREDHRSYAAKKNLIIVDGSKLSTHLGEKWAVLIEVLPFAHGATRAHLEKHGKPQLRSKDGATVRTDAGNLIYDLATGPIEAPGVLDSLLRAIPGVVETGLFVGRADVVIVAADTGVRRLTRSWK